MIQWYYADAAQTRQGPVDAAGLVRMRLSGQLDWNTLVWREGLDDWRPMRDCAAELAQVDERAAAPAAPAQAMAAAPPARDPHPARPAIASAAASPYAPPSAAVSDQAPVLGGEVVYGGILRRFAALAIDNFIVAIAFYLAFLAIMLSIGFGSTLALSDAGGIGSGMMAAMALGYLCYPLISALYFVLLESSPQQATLGKLAVGIKVVDTRGGRLGRGHALGRWVSHLLCYVTLYLGYLVAAFTGRRQGLHDMAASTLVVDRWAYTDHPELQRRTPGALTWVIVVLGGAVMLLGLLAMVAAVAIPAFAG